MIALNYSKFEVSKDKIKLWYELIGDLPFELAQIALKKVMLTSQFPPTVADIRKAATEIVTPAGETLDAGKAWGEVQKAISKYGWPDPDNALASMSPLTQQVVNQISWQELCSCEESGVIRGQFMKMFNALAERQKEQRTLPATLKDEIAKIGNTMAKQIKGDETANEN